MELKKVFATVTSDDFRAFCRRCREENVSIGKCLTQIVSAYARGANIVCIKVPKVNAHHKPTGINYAEEHKNNNLGEKNGKNDTKRC